MIYQNQWQLFILRLLDINTMNQIIEYFEKADALNFICGIIIACVVIRYCYEILKGE